MIITTTLSVEGRTVSEYLGIVSAAQVMVMPGGNKGVQRGWQAGVDGATEILLATSGISWRGCRCWGKLHTFRYEYLRDRDSCPLNLSPYSDTLWIGIYTVSIPYRYLACTRACARDRARTVSVPVSVSETVSVICF